MAKPQLSGSKTVNAANIILNSQTSSKSEKVVAASALAQATTAKQSSSKVLSTASKILKDPKASAAAKSVAASALTQRPNFPPKRASADAIARAVESYLSKKK